ncbi:MAG: tetratricopeptide repeat protein [Nitrospirae bacterium]|nr:tetratricopeptide repeat protein [Nitrospirota bacterium]
MSLLADLLSKIKQPQAKREVPPNLVNIVQGSAQKSSNRRRLILLSVLVAVSVLTGVFLVYFTKSLSEKSAGDISTVTQNRVRRPGVAPQDGDKILALTQKTLPEQQDGLKQPLPPVESKKESERPLPEKARVPAPAAKKHERPVDFPSGNKESEAGAALEKLTATKKAAPDKAQTPHSRNIAAAVDSYLYNAREFELKRDYSKALENYKKVLEIDGDNFTVMNNIAYILLEMNLTEESVVYSRMAVERNNDYVPALINLGIAYAKSGNTRSSEEYLSHAFRLEPDNRSVILNLAVLYERQKDYDKASEYFTRLNKLGAVEGSLGMARLYELQGKTEDAIKRYRHIYEHASIDDKTRALVRQRIVVLQNKK